MPRQSVATTIRDAGAKHRATFDTQLAGAGLASVVFKGGTRERVKVVRVSGAGFLACRNQPGGQLARVASGRCMHASMQIRAVLRRNPCLCLVSASHISGGAPPVVFGAARSARG